MQLCIRNTAPFFLLVVVSFFVGGQVKLEYLHTHALEMSISKFLINALFFSQLQTTHFSCLVLVSNQVCVCVCEICTEARDRLEEPQEISVSFIFPLLPLTLLPLRDGILTLRPSFLPSSYSSLPPLLWLPSFMSPCLDCPYIQHCFGVLLLKPITLLSPTLAERCI